MPLHVYTCVCDLRVIERPTETVTGGEEIVYGRSSLESLSVSLDNVGELTLVLIIEEK